VTERLYYTEPYRTEFEATVLACERQGDRLLAFLDRTAFYPTSGGQPHDTGRLGEAHVIEVLDQEDGRVAHVIDRNVSAGARVEGRIDWPRRFDHMQQHTGQHVLSAAFARRCNARTVSFHLGSAASTIDLASGVTPDQIAQAETEANRIVWEDRPVAIRFASAEEAAGLPLRKEPVRAGPLRLIDIADFDLSACGGTHVARTGGIGMIAVSRFERFKGGTRIEFLCGGRALEDTRALRSALQAALRLLPGVAADLPGAIERLQGEARDLKKARQELQVRLAQYEAERLAARALDVDGVRLVAEEVAGQDAAGLKSFAAAVAARPDHLAVIVSDAVPRLVVIARAAGLPTSAADLLQGLTSRFGGRGGGKPDLAQGGGVTASLEEIRDAVRTQIAADGRVDALSAD
jgi:alanyl-tRNA synthetase